MCPKILDGHMCICFRSVEKMDLMSSGLRPVLIDQTLDSFPVTQTRDTDAFYFLIGSPSL